MATDNNTTLTHVYGVFGIIPAIVGLVFLVKSDAPWQQYALLLSGWVACVPLWLMLVKCFNKSRSDAEQIGALQERINGLEKLVESRGETMDVLAGLITGRTAIPRARPATVQPEEEQ
jgi:hypothetical protein